MSWQLACHSIWLLVYRACSPTPSQVDERSHFLSSQPKEIYFFPHLLGIKIQAHSYCLDILGLLWIYLTVETAYSTPQADSSFTFHLSSLLPNLFLWTSLQTLISEVCVVVMPVALLILVPLNGQHTFPFPSLKLALSKWPRRHWQNPNLIFTESLM